MTETEWFNCTDPAAMIQLLETTRFDDRKLRLFAVACCRRIWHRITDERSRRAVKVAELFADGIADEDERCAAVAESMEACVSDAGFAVLYACSSPNGIDAITVADYASWAEDKSPTQTSLLHCIFGNPFRQFRIAPTVLAWNDGTVIRLARTAYDERHLPEGTLDNGRLAILADALEEAGCTDADILDHLRGPGPHVRGCWPVDLVLGKS